MKKYDIPDASDLLSVLHEHLMCGRSQRALYDLMEYYKRIEVNRAIDESRSSGADLVEVKPKKKRGPGRPKKV